MNAVEELYLSLHDGLARMVARIVPQSEVEDIVQETYIRLRRAVVTQEIRHPRSYIYQTARNLALDSLKKGGNTIAVEWCENADYMLTQGDATVDAVESHESFGRFCDAVHKLPQRAQQAFVLKKVYGYSQREIAAELNIAESTVEKHVALAMRRCIGYMAEAESIAQVA